MTAMESATLVADPPTHPASPSTAPKSLEGTTPKDRQDLVSRIQRQGATPSQSDAKPVADGIELDASNANPRKLTEAAIDRLQRWQNRLDQGQSDGRQALEATVHSEIRVNGQRAVTYFRDGTARLEAQGDLEALEAARQAADVRGLTGESRHAFVAQKMAAELAQRYGTVAVTRQTFAPENAPSQPAVRAANQDDAAAETYRRAKTAELGLKGDAFEVLMQANNAGHNKAADASADPMSKLGRASLDAAAAAMSGVREAPQFAR